MESSPSAAICGSILATGYRQYLQFWQNMVVAIKVTERGMWEISSPLHNRLTIEDRPIHAWYRFVLSFPPHLVRDYFDSFKISATSTLLDPFCGTGTTLVEAKKHGIASHGIEANPMAALASRVKTNWTIDGEELLRVANEVAASTRTELLRQHYFDIPPSRVPSKEQVTIYESLDLNVEQSKLILRNSISPRPLHRALALLERLSKVDPPLNEPLRLALAWTLVNTAGNLRFGPEVGVTMPKYDVDVVADWLGQVERMSRDLEEWKDLSKVQALVHESDARSIPQAIPDASVDFVFTSPPYPNEKDYTRTTRLESVLLGLIQTRTDLKNLKKGLMRSNTRNVYVGDDDHIHVEDIAEIQRIAAEIEARRLELGKTSGFERLYHKVTKLYFGGMAKHFRELKRVLKPGAMLGYVVGDQASYLRVMIRTGQLISQIAEREGYELVRIDLFRTRYATATKDQLREEVVVLRWPGG